MHPRKLARAASRFQKYYGMDFSAGMAGVVSVNYHCNDFDYNSWAKEASEKYCLPPVIAGDGPANLETRRTEVQNWNSFYRNHRSGNFFKPRNYLFAEFYSWLSPYCSDDYSGDRPLILEVGCGHGCSMYPLLKSLPSSTMYIATDYSPNALSILREHSNYNETCIKTAVWDVTVQAEDTYILQHPPQIIMCIFALSAVKPEHHLKAFCNMASVLTSGGTILFRDYGLHDMTMYRHCKRHGENLYERNDRTLAFYFDLDYVRQVATSSGLNVVELWYATVEVRNRRKDKCMRRVFVHAVLQKF